MNCAEVTEWMHRYLDHDLSQDEMIEMFRHIDDCPACAEMFERLNLLSKQLEELPDVKPPFSLVDSILPRLDELDREAAAAPAQPAAVEDERVIPLAGRSGRSKAARKRSTLATRTGIGAVAAAVLLLIAIVRMPESMPAADTDEALQYSMNTAAENSAASPEFTESTADQSDMAKMSTFSGDTAADSEPADNAADAGAADQAAPAELAPPATEAPAAEPAPRATKKPASAKQSAPVKSGGGAATAKPAQDNNATDSAPAAITKGADAADVSPERQPEDRAAAANMEYGVMGILPGLTAADEPMTSPDGRYAAELAGQQLVIYSLPADEGETEQKAIATLPLNGVWVSGAWSEDSLEFTYVTEIDGVQTAGHYSVTAEGAATPASSPEAPAAATPSAGASAAPGASATPGSSN
ncbi:anti-sigma factor family protein [Paenibacillus tengchongensis]|uniref:anti-sigma factor family protein n=1 Tax=Paenibacillus tengchongensis TaxID=2608684 RepID=UPI00124DF9FF|nr:anti-sigma factor [Paenibacillus tengchongensis]